MTLDTALYRKDFPILQRLVHGKPLVYLDSAATALKPQCVIDAVTGFYTHYTANVHRAVHALAEEATEAFEGARSSVARFIRADSREVALVRNATEALNVIAHSLRDRGAVAVSNSEHHSNLLPWRQGKVVLLDLLPSGEIDLDRAKKQLSETKPALLAISTINNVLGTPQPVSELTQVARSIGAMVLLDASQSVGHEPVDVRQLDCDYLCFSGHKMLGPSGIGVLYQRESIGLSIKPLLYGGSMVHQVHCDGFVLRPFPWCLEAGTPNIEGAIGLGAACDYLEEVDPKMIRAHCRSLTKAVRSGLRRIDSVRLHGDTDVCTDSIVSFSIKGMEAHGVARMLSNRFGIIVRSGYHCAQPLHETCGLPESIRISVHLYNTHEEMEELLAGVSVVAKFS